MPPRIPAEEECVAILREEGCPRAVIEHVCTVEVIAVAMAERCAADLELVRAGALLHDVGRSRTQGVLHVSEGVSIARRRRLPERLVRVISRHVAAGFTPEEARALGLPEGDYMPRTLEEKIVCHADNLVKGARGIQTLAEAMTEIERRGYPVTARRMQAMQEELEKACGTDIDALVRELGRLPRLKGPCAAYTSD
jgi:uncharacterized protein (TIGR00295 family)